MDQCTESQPGRCRAIVSQKVGEFLEKSENLSGGLEVQIQSLNETGVNTADLQTRLASYNQYIKSCP